MMIFSQCKKSGTNCVTNSGSVVLEKRILPDFDSIQVEEYVNIFLTQDSINSVTVESGKNIIDGITTDVSGHLLIIKNTNICNWLRSYNIPVNVHISVRNLQKIFYYGSGNITSTSPILSRDLQVYAWEGCGTIDLNINSIQGYFFMQQGTTNLVLRGHCAICTVYNNDLGPFDGRSLETNYTFVTNSGSNDCYVNTSHYLEATINSIGNIYYTGTPDTILTHIYGEGKVIKY